ncbi:hypothetical protein DRN86_01620 [Candidatus Geothermarchaeota archaeon]|nr:MAG: hypothetical protein DRN86_01620 [Candidatus Geothermarchaeota archaeon]
MALSKSLVRVSYALFGRIVPRSKRLIEHYRKSGVFLTYEGYMSLAFFTASLISVICLASLVTLKLALGCPFLSIIWIAIAPISIFALTICAFLVYPSIKRAYVVGRISRHLFLTCGLMRIISASGLPFERVLEDTSQIIPEKYTKHYLSEIIRNIKLFGMGTEDAIDEVVKTIPFERLSNILRSSLYATKTVGSPSEYLRVEMEKLREEKIRELDRKITSLTFFGEIYITLLVVSPLIFIVIISILSLLGVPFLGLPTEAWLNLLTFVIVPTMAIALGIFLDLLMGE